MQGKQVRLGRAVCTVAVGVLLTLTAATSAGMVSFQQGMDSGFGVYTGAADTFVAGGAPDANYDTEETLWVDYDGGGAETLLVFKDIIGAGGGQIPLGSTINSAKLTFYVINDGTARNPVQMLQPWDAATLTLNNAKLGGNTLPGIQGDNVEAKPVPQGPGTAFHATPAGATFDVDVTALVQEWASGAGNFGMWFPAYSDDGLGVASSDHATVGIRPLLTVEFVPEPASLALLALGGLALARQRRRA